jgi:hypothetical protein
MHDSPVAILGWMADKLFLWSDECPWTPTEIITWTLLHYFTGLTTSFRKYFEKSPPEHMKPGSDVRKYLNTTTGYSAFPKKLSIMPRSWAEIISNTVSWQENEWGGDFAVHEKPEELADDIIRFCKPAWENMRR